jgi:ABC-type Zn uptake system ZnuABC Zn-binding protein ZnuA
MSKRPLAVVGATILVAQIFCTSVFAASLPTRSESPVKVVATLPILKEFTEQVGHEHVHVTTLITGFETEHSYAPRPSHLKAISEAHVIVEVGLGLEVWVRGLIKNAGNERVRLVTTSEGVSVIADPDKESHSAGNPHIWLDPENAKIMTRHIATALIELDPVHKQQYEANRDVYLTHVDNTQKQLQARVAGLTDRRIITYHPAWPYFARRFGFQIVGDIVRQFGTEPSGAHLARLVHHIKTEGIKVIVSEPQLNQKVAQVLATESGARIVILSPLTGVIRGTDTYLALLTYDVLTLVDALQS